MILTSMTQKYCLSAFLSTMDHVSILIFLLGLLFIKDAAAQSDSSCVAGQLPGFPWNIDPCFVCVLADSSGLCGIHDTDCTWGIDPDDPICSPEPVSRCHPDEVPPTIDPSIAALVGGQPCLSCLDTNTHRPCTGAEGEICDWLNCPPESESPAPTDVVPTLPPLPSAPTDVVPTLPPLPCQPGDITPTQPGVECLACLNNATSTLCRGLENEACFWKDCDEQVEPMFFCQPGAEFEIIPGVPECNGKCRNDEGELCVEADLWCNFATTALELQQCFESTGITVPPTLPTVDPCPNPCSPGSTFDVGLDGCHLQCRNSDTSELCVAGDDCCHFGLDLSDESCIPPPLTTTAPEPKCQPGDQPPVEPSILCFLCLGRNGGACVEGQYCEWQQVGESRCHVPTETATTKMALKSDAPIGCQPATKPDDCPLCLCLNGNCTQCSGKTGESCVWQDVYSCTPSNTPPTGEEIKKKIFSLTFKVDDCRDILDNKEHKQEFLENLIQKTMDLIGTKPMEIYLYCGSLIAEFAVEDDYLDLEAAEQKLNRKVKDGNFRVRVDGTEYTATSFKDITHRKPKKDTSPFSSFTSLSWFIIAAVAFVLLFGIFIFSAAVCCETAGLRTHKKEAILVEEQDGSYSQEPTGKLTSDDMYEHNIDIMSNDYIDDTHM